MNPIKPLKRKVSVILDEDVIERIKRLAKESNRSFPRYVNLVLRGYLNSNPPDRQ